MKTIARQTTKLYKRVKTIIGIRETSGFSNIPLLQDQRPKQTESKSSWSQKASHISFNIHNNLNQIMRKNISEKELFKSYGRSTYAMSRFITNYSQFVKNVWDK